MLIQSRSLTCFSRHIVHNTTRGISKDGVTMRVKTDWHITVYIWIPELGYWQHGDIFHHRRGRVGCALMKNERRRDRGGEGIELWAYPEDERHKSLTRAQRNERLAQAIKEGRWCTVVVYKEKKYKDADQLDGVDDGDYEEDQIAMASSPNSDMEVGGNVFVGGGLTTAGSSQVGGNAHIDLDSRVAGNLKIGNNSYTGGNVLVGSTGKLNQVYPFTWHNHTWGPNMSNTNKRSTEEKLASGHDLS